MDCVFHRYRSGFKLGSDKNLNNNFIILSLHTLMIIVLLGTEMKINYSDLIPTIEIYLICY